MYDSVYLYPNEKVKIFSKKLFSMVMLTQKATFVIKAKE